MGKLNPVEINFWLSEARSCFARQKKELMQRNSYPFLINYYEGADSVVTSSNSQIATARNLSIINEYFPNVNSMIAQLMYQNPDIIADASKPEAEGDGEDLMKAALTYGFNKTDSLVENRVALFDMIMGGYSAVEVDHLSNTNQRNQKDLLPSDEEIASRKTLVEKAKGLIKKPKNTNEAEENLAKTLPPEIDAYATNEFTYVRRYNPLDIPLDWRARRLKDRRYNLKRVWLSRSEFNIRYPKFKDKLFPEASRFEFANHEHADHSGRVMLYEFQIKRKANRYDTIIISPHILTEELDMFTRPYTTNGFNMKIGSLHKYGMLYPISMAQVNKKINDEMNNYVRHMMEVSKRNIPKRIGDKNKLDSAAIDALNDDKVNQLALVDGNPNSAVVPAPHTNVSIENKELISMFGTQKEKLWGISETSLSGKSTAKFATQLAIQEKGFEEKTVDIQEGLRMLIVDELETMKDIIASLWDQPYFFKVTGGEKPKWYVPVLDPKTGRVLNPLADTLTGDYFIKVDISSALRPNKSREKSESLVFIQNLAGLAPILQAQGKTINVEEIARLSKKFGFEPTKLFIDAQPPPVEGEGQPQPGGQPVV